MNTKSIVVLTLILVGTIVAGTSAVLFSQPQRGGGPPGGQPNVTDPYVGILSSKGAEQGLFPIKSTGVSTEPMQKAAEALRGKYASRARQSAHVRGG